MRNLMHANFIRYISRLSTLIAFAISLTLGFVTAYDSVKETYVNGIKNAHFMPELQYLLFVFFLAVIVSVVNIGSEFAAGTIRNKLVSIDLLQSFILRTFTLFDIQNSFRDNLL